MILLKLLLLPVTIALSLMHMVLRLITGLVGAMLGHIVLIGILIGGIWFFLHG